MQDEIISPNEAAPMGAIETWIKALTQPNQAAYQQIVNDPGASIGKAVLWLALFGFFGGLLSGIIQAIAGTSFVNQISQFAEFGSYGYDMPVSTGSGFMSIVGSAFGGLFGGIIGALIYAALVQLVAKMLGGTGTFEKLFYGFTAYGAPLGMLTSVLGAIPFIGCIGVPLAIYGIVLNVIANQAANEYDTGKAVISSLAPGLVLFLLCCCVMIVFGAILGPIMGETFGNIVNTMP